MNNSTSWVETDALRIGFEARGEGAPIVLLHGWPDDIRTWDKVTDALVAQGYRTLTPYLRGYGASTFTDDSTLRSGQVVAFAQDIVDFLDALELEKVTFVGHDWGARAGYALAALWPQRVQKLVTLAAGYETGIKPGQEIEPKQAHAYWYQWLFNTQQGREALKNNRQELCRYLWRVWAPDWKFGAEEFEATAASWQNPDWVEITLHSYRVRWGNAPKDPRYAELEERLEKHPKIEVPTVLLHGENDGASLVDSSAGQENSFGAAYRRQVLPGVGHFVQRESPQSVIEAVLNDVD